MIIIGLTGGIGSGKSIAAQYFAELGIDVIDADQIAKEAVSPESNALKKIVTYFGKNILQDDGRLNRKKLRDIIFQNKKEKQWLENLLHPLIHKRIQEKIQKAKPPYCVVVIPLLVETNVQYVDRILVIDCPEVLQIQRIQYRDHINITEIETMIASQASRQKRLAVSDDVIHNDSDLNNLREQVIKLDNKYRKLSAE